MKVVIFTGGEFLQSNLTKQAVQQADMVLAADSGATTALSLGIYPSAVLGDLDSIDKKTQDILTKRGIPFVDMPTTLLSLPKGHTKPLDATEKDQTDTELAIGYAIQKGASEITILGGIMGDRFDHIIANLILSTTYSIPIRFVTGQQVIWVAKGPHKQNINGKKGDTLSLLPLSPKVTQITSAGLYYPLANVTLTFGKPRAVSNVLTVNKATVTFGKGILLFVHTHE